jgi:hypothetical protein
MLAMVTLEINLVYPFYERGGTNWAAQLLWPLVAMVRVISPNACRCCDP